MFSPSVCQELIILRAELEQDNGIGGLIKM